MNDKFARTCGKCGTPLDVQAIEETELRQKEELKKMLKEQMKESKAPVLMASE